MLKIDDIHTYYGESYVLQGISLEVGEGSVVAILGRNGMGKTTLIRSIVGFTPPRRGRIFFKGVDITHIPAFKIVRMHMGLVPQGRRIFPSLSVLENLRVGAREQNWAPIPGTKSVYMKFFRSCMPSEITRAISLAAVSSKCLPLPEP